MNSLFLMRTIWAASVNSDWSCKSYSTGLCEHNCSNQEEGLKKPQELWILHWEGVTADKERLVNLGMFNLYLLGPNRLCPICHSKEKKCIYCGTLKFSLPSHQLTSHEMWHLSGWIPSTAGPRWGGLGTLTLLCPAVFYFKTCHATSAIPVQMSKCASINSLSQTFTDASTD